MHKIYKFDAEARTLFTGADRGANGKIASRIALATAETQYPDIFVLRQINGTQTVFTMDGFEVDTGYSNSFNANEINSYLKEVVDPSLVAAVNLWHLKLDEIIWALRKDYIAAKSTQHIPALFAEEKAMAVAMREGEALVTELEQRLAEAKAKLAELKSKAY